MNSEITQPLVWPNLAGIDANGKPFLQGARCDECSHVTLGTRELCPHCWARGSMRRFDFGQIGRVYTRTVVHQLSPGFDEPYVAGMIDFPEGVRLFAHLANGDDSPQIGDIVDLRLAEVRKDEKGVSLLGPRYVRLGQRNSHD